MKKKENEVRRKMIVVRMNEIEFEQMENLIKRTTAQSVSEYARKLLLVKPVIVKYRNQSADEFLKVIIVLKKEFNAIGNNLNQMVKRLYLLEKIPEFREWLAENRQLQNELISKMNEIKFLMNQQYKQWSQK